MAIPCNRHTVAVGLLLAVHAVLGLHTAVSKSVTHDEAWHLPVGLLNLTTGRFGYDNLNPPLTRMWAALPLAAGGVRAEPGRDVPDTGLRFVQQQPDRFHTWYVWGRAFNLLLSVATGMLLAKWAGELWGSAAALGAALLYCTCPNILAHASLVTPDAGLMLGCLASLYLFWRWSQDRTWTAAILLGVVLGLAQATKFTAVLLYLVLGIVWLGLAVLPKGVAPPRWRFGLVSSATGSAQRLSAWQFPAAIVISLVVLNAVYLFGGTGRPLGGYHFQSRALMTVGGWLAPLASLPVPLPNDYLDGLDAQRAVMESPHPVFLDGQWSVTGFPAYYPKTLLYKLPHPLQLAVIAGCLCTWLWRPAHIPRRVHALVWLMVLGLLVTAGTTPMQLGVRYVLPLLPLGMLYSGGLARWIAARPRAIRTAAIVLAIVACGASLRHHPHHLAYFNESAGGPIGGREHLVDSNIDWGQDLHLVKRFMDERNLETIGLAYFGTVPPELIGIDYTLPPGRTAANLARWSLPPGWYAVSVNYVMGRPHTIHQPDGGSHGVDVDEFGYFRGLEPVARLGYSIDVYHVEAEPPNGSL